MDDLVQNWMDQQEHDIRNYKIFFWYMKLNKEWHLKNKMPKNAGFAERVKWHLAHIKNCSCRPIPEKLLEEMQKQGIKGPK